LTGHGLVGGLCVVSLLRLIGLPGRRIIAWLGFFSLHWGFLRVVTHPGFFLPGFLVFLLVSHSPHGLVVGVFTLAVFFSDSGPVCLDRLAPVLGLPLVPGCFVAVAALVSARLPSFAPSPFAFAGHPFWGLLAL